MKTRTFLSLLSPGPFRQHIPIEESDLPILRQLSLDHNLFMLFYSRLQVYQQRFPGDPASRSFIGREKALYLQGISFSMKQEAVEREVVGALRSRGVPSVVIKGNALARDLYGDPNCRSSSDIDLLVRREDAARADAALKEAGYACDVTVPFGYCIHRQHHAGYHDPSRGQHLELHWLFAFPLFFSLESADIWQGIVWDDAGVGHLTPEMTVIMLLMHHHSHSFRELRILVDILWALDKFGSSMDISALSARLQTIGLTKTTLLTLSQIRALWPEEWDGIPAIRALSEALAGEGCRVAAFLVNYFRMDCQRPAKPEIYKDKLVARFALDGWRRILRSFMLVLLPPPEAIRALYGDHRTWTLPLNYLRYLTWRIKDWTK